MIQLKHRCWVRIALDRILNLRGLRWMSHSALEQFLTRGISLIHPNNRDIQDRNAVGNARPGLAFGTVRYLCVSGVMDGLTISTTPGTVIDCNSSGAFWRDYHR